MAPCRRSSISVIPSSRCPVRAKTGGASPCWRTRTKGLKGVSAGDPSIIGAYALKVTYDILDGNAARRQEHLRQCANRDDGGPGSRASMYSRTLSPTLDADTDIPGRISA